ncbi:MAG: hypothetical protein R2795_25715 [Saprospiraceae bacterium]
MMQYLAPEVTLHYFTSMFTIKSKLKANFIDDGRPTEIARLQDTPAYYCIFTKSTRHEIEKMV